MGDSVARILEEMGLEACGAPGTTAALAMLNDAVKKGGLMASSHVGGLSGAFIPVSEDEGMIDAVQKGSLSIEKLEAMTCVCSVGLDMIAVEGDTSAATISGIIAGFKCGKKDHHILRITLLIFSFCFRLFIACFGLHPIVNMKEERDRESIELPPFQRAVIRRLGESYKNIILLLLGNAPLAVKEEDEAPEIRAMLWSALGCEELGNGIADIMTGRMTPAGRTSQTWYEGDYQLADIEEYDIRKSGMTYLFMKEKPLYRFGYGLTYSDFSFEFSKREKAGSDKENTGICDGSVINDVDSDDIVVVVKNTGSLTSDCTVQLYQSPDGEFYIYDNDRDGRDTLGREIPLESRLVFFKRLYDVKPGEVRTVAQ